MTINMSISGLRSAYQTGELTPEQLIKSIWAQIERNKDKNIWIHVLTESEIIPYLEALKEKDPESCPLWGVPFAIKDNIDLAGIPTTAACEAFSFTPDTSAQVVQQLLDAGALPIGKTNLDQFATGLNGTRSPWGPCKNSFNPDYISGGSSSGSSVAVSLGLASFSLGTDTAGSGRIPACFNNLVGVKPSIGLLSANGMLPACRSLDCMTIFAFNCDDANLVLSCAEGYDTNDAYSRKNPFHNQSRHYGLRKDHLRVGVIAEKQLLFFGDAEYQKSYSRTLKALADNGFEFVEIDFSPFMEAANLLYAGPWVAERYIATLPLIEEQPEAMFPVVREIIEAGVEPAATDLFKAEYRLNELKKLCRTQIESFECILTPTAGKHFTIEEMLADPVQHNTKLGYYTNFMNLLDFAAVSVPTAMTETSMPFGITLFSDKFQDRALLSIANRIQQCLPMLMGATGFQQPELSSNSVSQQQSIDVLVCGAHLQGFPLNWQLTERGAVLKETTTTAPLYRMYLLAGGPPYRPGLIMDGENGRSIDVEVWSVPASEFGSFVNGIPSPLGIGKVTLADNREVTGFICETRGLEGAEEITQWGGWENYFSQR